MDMVRDLDDITFTEWFTQLGGGRGSLDRMWDPIAYALGFVDCDHISVRCMLTMFMLFAIRTEVTCSVLRMLEGSPQTGLRDPIIAYLEERGDKINLGIPCRDIVHEVDEEGKPTRSPQTGLQDPIIAYLEERGIKINLGIPCRDIVHEVDEEGQPTRVSGIDIGCNNEFSEFDVVVAALGVYHSIN